MPGERNEIDDFFGGEGKKTNIYPIRYCKKSIPSLLSLSFTTSELGKSDIE